MLRYVELFAGVGGFRLGIERAIDDAAGRRQKEPLLEHDEVVPNASSECTKQSTTSVYTSKQTVYANGSALGGEQTDPQGESQAGQGLQPTQGESAGAENGRSGECAADGANERSLCVFASEWDKYAAQTYDKNFGGEIDQRDIRTIPTSDIPDHDLLVGGFPCQAFSIAGKRAGFNDTRGTMFFEVARILKDKRPGHLVLENVKGLLSHNRGQTFQTILTVLADLGYRVEWQVLNSKDFGVPQNRERVYIIGHLRERCTEQVLPICPDTSKALAKPEFLRINGVDRSTKSYDLGESNVASTLTSTMYKGIDAAGRTGVIEHARTLDANYYKGLMANQARTGVVELAGGSQDQRVYDKNGLSPTLGTMQGGNKQPKIIGGLQVHQSPRNDGVSPTLTSAMGAGGGQTPVLLEPTIRRLTPKECERLQGFPDYWTDGVSDTQRYKQMGNAVTVNVVEAVIRNMPCLSQ